tara:strand:- start:48 stop:539 length:492 start_codon:yes stop_codon:yes gene_type:complete
METAVDRDHLAEQSRIWTASRLSWFPLWEFGDIWSEAYIQGHAIIHLWKPGRGGLGRFLALRLFERVWPCYLRDTGRRPIRLIVNGKYEKRSSVLVAESIGRRQISYTPKPPTKMPSWVDERDQRIFDLMARGLSQRQAAEVEGISEGALSRRLKHMGSRLYD